MYKPEIFQKWWKPTLCSRYILEKRSHLQCTTLFIHKSCADPCQIRYSISKSTSNACRCHHPGVLPPGHDWASISGVILDLFVWSEVQALWPFCIPTWRLLCTDLCQIRYLISKSTSDACHCRLCRLGVLSHGNFSWNSSLVFAPLWPA